MDCDWSLEPWLNPIKAGTPTSRERPLLKEALRQPPTLQRRTPMPMVNVQLIEGVFTPAQKQEMIRKLTDAMVSIEGENMRPVTWVVIDEVKSGDWGIGGKPLTTGDVKALAAGKPDH
jgi:4-oxalocrotonate tautomerase